MSLYGKRYRSASVSGMYIKRSRSRSSFIPSCLPSHHIYTTILAASWTTHIDNIHTIMTTVRASPFIIALLLSCSLAQAFPSRPFSPMAESVQKVSEQALFKPIPSTNNSRRSTSTQETPANLELPTACPVVRSRALCRCPYLLAGMLAVHAFALVQI